MLKFICLVLILPGILSAVENPQPKLLYVLPTDESPAFCKVIKNNLLTGIPSEPVYDLSITTFSANPKQLDPVLRVEGVSKKYLDASQMNESIHVLTDKLTWPNEVDSVPEHIFALPYVWSASTGFFIRGQDDGVVALMDMTDMIGGQSEPVIISSNPDGILWYYHRVEWHDMNGDGYPDAVTERANGGGPSADKTQLVWFENPRSQFLTPEWDVHVLNEDVEDVHFRIHDLPYNGGITTVIISSGFYSNKLSLVWSSTNDFTDLSSIQTRIIDTYGWYFDVEIVDVNLDGKFEVLTSTWSQQGKPGAVIAYEIPTGDWTTDPWTRHILQDGYKNFIIAGTGSPGAVFTFYPSTDMKGTMKPFVMVSGDDDGQVYVLTPDSQQPDDWSYTQTTIYKGSNTIGGVAVEDVDLDGFAEVFIPAYTNKDIVVMTYRT